MQYRNYVWHSEVITNRYDVFVHVMIHSTREEHISMCTRRSVAVLSKFILLCQVYSSLNSNGIQSNIAWTFSIVSICKLNVLTMPERYLYYVVMHLLQRYNSVYKLMLFYYYYWNSYSLIILLHVHF